MIRRTLETLLRGSRKTLLLLGPLMSGELGRDVDARGALHGHVTGDLPRPGFVRPARKHCPRTATPISRRRFRPRRRGVLQVPPCGGGPNCGAVVLYLGTVEKRIESTPFDMVVPNDMDRFHLAQDVIDRVPSLGGRAGYVKQAIRDALTEHRQYINERGDDHPLVAGWRGRANEA